MFFRDFSFMIGLTYFKMHGRLSFILYRYRTHYPLRHWHHAVGNLYIPWVHDFCWLLVIICGSRRSFTILIFTDWHKIQSLVALGSSSGMTYTTTFKTLLLLPFDNNWIGSCTQCGGCITDYPFFHRGSLHHSFWGISGFGDSSDSAGGISISLQMEKCRVMPNYSVHTYHG